jgi:proline iminopeptidase
MRRRVAVPVQRLHARETRMRVLAQALFLVSLSWASGAAQTTDPLAPGEHEVELRGVSIWYLVRGNGPVLLIQPGGAGWGGDATVYVETLRPLEAAYTLVYYDPRGIGRSGRSDPSLYTLDEYVDDLEALRLHLDLEALNLAGHSHGGSVALKYALAHPHRVERLLVLNSGPFVRDLDPDWLAERAGYEAAQARWAAVDTTLSADELHAEFIRTFVPVLHFYDYAPLRQTVKALLARTTFSAEPFQQSERELATFDIRDRVAEIRAPTLIVIGDHDPPDLREGSNLLHERIPGAQLFVAPGCGHWTMLECPEVFFPAVLRFLAQRR